MVGNDDYSSVFVSPGWGSWGLQDWTVFEFNTSGVNGNFERNSLFLSSCNGNSPIPLVGDARK